MKSHQTFPSMKLLLRVSSFKTIDEQINILHVLVGPLRSAVSGNGLFGASKSGR